MLKNGWEPVKVMADGNCLFRSLSVLLTGVEDHLKLIKLATIRHGCTNEKYYIKNANMCIENYIIIIFFKFMQNFLNKFLCNFLIF